MATSLTAEWTTTTVLMLLDVGDCVTADEAGFTAGVVELGNSGILLSPEGAVDNEFCPATFSLLTASTVIKTNTFLDN